MDLKSTKPLPSHSSNRAFTAQSIPSTDTEAGLIFKEIKSIGERIDEMISNVRNFLDQHPIR